uniref:Uncharacterized protein n=1 Tax=Caenorhabditis japonica TaxID=281687 RepID=A0A8R1IFV2_CAEJA
MAPKRWRARGGPVASAEPPRAPARFTSDCNIPLKLFLEEKRFAKYEDLKMAVFDFFDSQSAAFWKKGINNLPERTHSCDK